MNITTNFYNIIYPKYPYIPTNPNSDNVAVSSLVGSALKAGGLDNKLLMYASGALGGGIAAEITGGNFLEGAATGLIVTVLNHALHEVADPGPKKQQEILQKKLISRIKELFPDLKLENYDVIKITTLADADGQYKTTVEGLFKGKDGSLELAFTSSRADSKTGIYSNSTLHISPKLLLKGSDGLFKLITAHELGHANDNKIFNSFNQDKLLKVNKDTFEIRANNFANQKFGLRWTNSLYNEYNNLKGN